MRGYTVITNTSGKGEFAIEGTDTINVPIERLVPFLEFAGALIGARSGLFDVTESANIRRVILYGVIRTGKRGAGKNNNRFLPHFSFNKWYGRNDALELEYDKSDEAMLYQKIIDYLSVSKEELECGVR